ncbi:hypothetical protein EPN90_03565 [Patescibacteria group bacterium]|nr:MAG: hypothetical protein EPN90_03565 [Patescibacteria group bacterium]
MTKRYKFLQPSKETPGSEEKEPGEKKVLLRAGTRGRPALKRNRSDRGRKKNGAPNGDAGFYYSSIPSNLNPSPCGDSL